MLPFFPFVIPAKAGIRGNQREPWPWIPAFAGMTGKDGLRFRAAIPSAQDQQDQGDEGRGQPDMPIEGAAVLLLLR